MTVYPKSVVDEAIGIYYEAVSCGACREDALDAVFGMGLPVEALPDGIGD